MHSFECSDTVIWHLVLIWKLGQLLFSPLICLLSLVTVSKNYFSNLSQSCRLIGQNISTYIGELLSMGLQNYVVHPIEKVGSQQPLQNDILRYTTVLPTNRCVQCVKRQNLQCPLSRCSGKRLYGGQLETLKRGFYYIFVSVLYTELPTTSKLGLLPILI